MPDPCPWRQLGPLVLRDASLPNSAPITRSACSGRVSALAYDKDGNTLFVGTAGGGVWKTTDQGLNWTPLTDQQLSLSVGAIAIAPSDGTIYVGTGEFQGVTRNQAGYSELAFVEKYGGLTSGAGILISSDGGTSWSLWPDPRSDPRLVGASISAISVDPADAGHFFVASDQGLFEAKLPSSLTLVQSDPAPIAGNKCWDLIVDWTASPPSLIAALDGVGVCTRFATEKLTAVPLANFKGVGSANGRVALSPSANPDVIYAVFANGPKPPLPAIFRSGDGGVNWTPIATDGLTDIRQTDYNLVLAVHPGDENELFFGDSRLWHYRPDAPAVPEKGKWTVIGDPVVSRAYLGVHVDQHAIVFNPHDAATMWVGNDGGVWLSTDEGITFEHRNRGLASLICYSLATHAAAGDVMHSGTQDNGSMRCIAHPAWQEGEDGDAFYVAIDGHDWYCTIPFTRESSGDVDVVFRSSKSGAIDTFEWKSNGIVAEAAWNGRLPIPPMARDPNTAGSLFLGTDAVYVTRDRGENWTRIRVTIEATKGDFITALAVAPNDPNVVYYARQSHRCFRLDRAGSTWTQQQLNATTDPPAPFSTIAVDSHNADETFFGVGAQYGTNRQAPLGNTVWHGTKNAAGGFDLTPLGHVADLDVPINSVGTKVTVGGANNPVNALMRDPDQATTLYAGCELGVFKSSDGGASWTPWNDGLPNTLVCALDFDRDLRLVRAATLGRGVWERSADDPTDPCDAARSELYLRRTIVDGGRVSAGKAFADGDNPIDDHGRATWSDGVDIKMLVQKDGAFATPSSTLDYTPIADPDYIGFEALASDAARANTPARIFVQVHNRGPARAHGAWVRLFFAVKQGASYPPLPDLFWSLLPFDPAAPSGWTVIGPRQDINVELGVPTVIRQDFTWPADLKGTIGILAIVGSDSDRASDAIGTDVEAAVRSDRHAALKEVEVLFSLSVFARDLARILHLTP